jgi:hypothetical protein
MHDLSLQDDTMKFTPAQGCYGYNDSVTVMHKSQQRMISYHAIIEGTTISTRML